MRRKQRPGSRMAHAGLALVVCLATIVPLAAVTVPAAGRDARATSGPLSPTPGPRSRAAAPLIPAAPNLTPATAATGICQCIADHDRRNIGCLGSADACKASCGDHYSFVPRAPSCPVTAQETGQ